MKKILFCVIVFVIALSTFSVAADTSRTQVIHTYSDINFDDNTVNPSDYYDFNDNTQGGYGLTVEDGVLKVSTMAEEITYNGSTFVVGSAGHGWQIVFPGEHLNGKCTNMYVTLEYDIKFEGFPFINRLFFVKGNDGKELVGPTVDTNGKLGIWPTQYAKDTLSVDTWYTIKFVFDLKAGIFDFLLDGDVVFSDRALPEGMNDIIYFNLPRFMGYSSDAYSTFYLDNIKLYSSADKYDVSVFAIDGEDETEGLDRFPISGGKIKLLFSQEMRDVTKENIIFKVNGAVEDFDIEFDSEGKKIAVITPKKAFSGREECSVELANLHTALGAGAISDSNIFEFSVTAPNYGILSVDYDGPEAGVSADFDVTIKNHTGEAREGLIIIGITDGRGRMVSKASCLTSSPTSENQTHTVSLRVPSQYNSQDYKIVAYLTAKTDFYEIDSVGLN